MSKHVLLSVFAFILAAVVPAVAQVGFGPEVGLGMSSMRFAPPTTPINYTSASVTAVPGWKVGGLVDIPLSQHIFFQPGAYLAGRGAKRNFAYYHNDSFNESVHQQLYLTYFDLPMQLVYKSGRQGKGRFTAGLGVTLSYMLRANAALQDRLVFNDSLFNTNIHYRIYPGTTFAAFDIGLTINLGYELPSGLFFRAYYIAGTNDISLNSEIDKNRGLGISAGYLFGSRRHINVAAKDLTGSNATTK